MPSRNTISVRNSESRKQLSGIVVTRCGIVIEAISVFSKAPGPKDTIVSGSVTLVTFLSANASVPICVTGTLL